MTIKNWCEGEEGADLYQNRSKIQQANKIWVLGNGVRE
jgi:hypothetical protein